MIGNALNVHTTLITYRRFWSKDPQRKWGCKWHVSVLNGLIKVSGTEYAAHKDTVKVHAQQAAYRARRNV